MRRLDVKAIQFKENGSWEVKESDNGVGASGDGDGLKASTSVNPLWNKPPPANSKAKHQESIEISDDEDKNGN